MLKHLAFYCSITLAALALAATTASALPTTYNFMSGSVVLRATLEGTTTSVLQGPASSVTLPLGGSYVVLDPDTGTNGTIVALEIVPTGTFSIDLDETIVGLDSVDVANAVLSEDYGHGASGDVSVTGSFLLDTLITADVIGTLPGAGGQIGPFPVNSLTSAAAGSVGVSGDHITLGLVGVNLAIFTQVANPTGPKIVLKADFTFLGVRGDVIPEPGTALLLGLGLTGLAATRRITT